MVIDTSAVVAILQDDAERRRFVELIAGSGRCLISVASRVEMSIVVESRTGHLGRSLLENFFATRDIETVPVSVAHADIAIDAFRRYGRGRHKAGLNFGDCFAYALAKAARMPLLFKGNDFCHTNIVSATPA